MAGIDRRQALRLGVLALTMIGTSTGVAQLATARSALPDDEVLFAEIYRKRWIRGIVELPGLLPRVFVDDVELHLMRLDTGGLTTHLNHYQSFGTARLAARAAVDSLNGATLLPFHR
jgi:hypothetical protein